MRLTERPPRRIAAPLAAAAACGLALAVLLTGGTGDGRAALGPVLVEDRFEQGAPGPNGLITNEHAFWNPADSQAVRSPVWEQTSGSFFNQAGTGWSGRPQGCTPDRYSERCTGSDVFRLHTRAAHLRNVRIDVELKVNSFQGTARRPSQPWDGVALWLRYVSDRHTYRAWVLRKDGRVSISKKCPGRVRGGSYYAGGTYFTLAHERAAQPVIRGRWERITAVARTNSTRSVTVAVYRNGMLLAKTTDEGTGCGPVRAAASVGIRGDNTDFNVDDFVVRRLLPAR